jgi:hypothetical protein
MARPTRSEFIRAIYRGSKIHFHPLRALTHLRNDTAA